MKSTGENCAKVLDVAKVITGFSASRSYRLNLIEWLQTATLEEVNSSVAGSFNLGVTFEGVPVSIGQSSSRDDWRRFQSLRNEGRLIEITEQTALSFFSMGPDTNAVNKWLECMKGRNYGLVLIESTRTNEELTAVVKWTPTVGGPRSTTLKIIAQNCRATDEEVEVAAGATEVVTAVVIDRKKDSQLIIASQDGVVRAAFGAVTRNHKYRATVVSCLINGSWNVPPTVDPDQQSYRIGIQSSASRAKVDRILRLNQSNVNLQLDVTVNEDEDPGILIGNVEILGGITNTDFSFSTNWSDIESGKSELKTFNGEIRGNPADKPHCIWILNVKCLLEKLS